eukprot:m.283798 g.283798  ORF g.283798 m.283798 type:complete len:589 (+) comp16338_c2_seq105:187-1953(+)
MDNEKEHQKPWEQAVEDVANVVNAIEKGVGNTEDAVNVTSRDLRKHIANSHDFACGKITDGLQPSQWLATLQHKAQETLESLPEILHAVTAQLGATTDPKLMIPKQNRDKIRQDAHIPYLTPKFMDIVDETIRSQKEQVSSEITDLTRIDVLACALGIHSAYVQSRLQESATVALIREHGQVQDVGPKKIRRKLRMWAKTSAELSAEGSYESDSSSVADTKASVAPRLGVFVPQETCLETIPDIVRLSVSCTSITEQMEVIKTLATMDGSWLGPVRSESSLADATAHRKRCSIYGLFCPVKPGSAPRASLFPFRLLSRSEKMTFKDMIMDGTRFAQATKDCQKREQVSDPCLQAALALLEHGSLAQSPLTMITEIQIYLKPLLSAWKSSLNLIKICKASSSRALTLCYSKYGAETPKPPQDVLEFMDAFGVSILDNNVILDGLRMGPSNGILLAKALSWIPNVTVLCLADNQIGSEAVKELVQQLTRISTIKELNLSKNNLGLEGAAYVADLIAGSKSLRKLWVSRNKFEAQGGMTIAEALKRNSTLQFLDIGNNNLGPEVRTMFSEIQGSEQDIQILLHYGHGQPRR